MGKPRGPRPFPMHRSRNIVPVHSSNFRAPQQRLVPNVLQALMSWSIFPWTLLCKNLLGGKKKATRAGPQSLQSRDQRDLEVRGRGGGGRARTDRPTGPGARGRLRQGSGAPWGLPRGSERAGLPRQEPAVRSRGRTAGVGCTVARSGPQPASQCSLLLAPRVAAGRLCLFPYNPWVGVAPPSPPLAGSPGLIAPLGPGRWTRAGARSFQPRTSWGPSCEAWRASAPGPEPAACAPNYLPGKVTVRTQPRSKSVDSLEPKATFLGEGVPNQRVVDHVTSRREETAGVRVNRVKVEFSLLPCPHPPNALRRSLTRDTVSPRSRSPTAPERFVRKETLFGPRMLESAPGGSAGRPSSRALKATPGCPGREAGHWRPPPCTEDLEQ